MRGRSGGLPGGNGFSMLKLNGRLEVNQVRCLEDAPEEQLLQRLGGSSGRKKGLCDCTIPQRMEGTGQV